MLVPEKISQLDLLKELLRRIETGCKPRDLEQFEKLYFDLTDAYERSVWNAKHCCAQISSSDSP